MTIARRNWLLHRLIAALVWVAAIAGSAHPAWAVKPISVAADQDRVEITALGELVESRGDSLQVETAASAEGTAGRMSVRATTPGTNPNWIVFALTNPTEVAVERWLTADRYAVIGSGAIWPDLDARRIEALTPSIGFVPERLASDRADVFRITLEPGQTITYVAELPTERYARVYLWKPIDYELKVRERQLFNGVMLGLTGLLAIFLTAIFAANHKIIFPVAALVAWCVLGYLCVDFGFFHKLFQLKPENNAVYRAATEASMAASLVVFLYFFLRIPLWHGLARMLFSVWILAQLALIAVAVIDPRLASTFARVSFAGIAGIGGAVVLFLAVRGQDRALSLVPTWCLLAVWVFGAAVTLAGKLSGDMVVSGLVAGLVLIVLLLGFTVTQFAFRSLEPLYGSAPSDLQTRSVAVDAAEAAVWEWSPRREEVKVGGIVEAALGLNSGELNTKLEDFLRHLHPSDRERFRMSLLAIQESDSRRIRTDFRMRHADNSYRWYDLDASSMPSSDGRTMKCVGLMRDVTDSKRAQERLLQNAVNDSLTGLANRQLFLDRLALAMQRARSEMNIRPTLLFIDLDKFKSVNTSFGVVVGDSLLLTVARRLQRHIGPLDTLARVGGDQFAILLLQEQPAGELASLAERVRRSLRSPIKIAGQEIVLTGSLGVAIYDGQEINDGDLLKEAELAMFRAKRAGTDRIEIFRPEMRGEHDERKVAEGEILKALEKNQLKVLYQPVVTLATEELAGFEAVLRWEHPKLGLINPVASVTDVETSDLIVKLSAFFLARAAKDCAAWQRELPRAENPLFVSLNLSSRNMFRPDLVQEVRSLLGRNLVPKGSLKIAVCEAMIVENPEHASEVLESLHGAGADLMLDDFGAGYSSLTTLHQLPFESIRIDRSVLRASGIKDGSNSAVFRSMMALSHELGKKVTAEGVDNEDEVGFLRALGCEYAQGYYYGDPIPDRDVLQLLKLVKKSERKLQPRRGLFRPTAAKRKLPNGSVEAPLAVAGVPSGQPAQPPPTGRRGMAPMPPPALVASNERLSIDAAARGGKGYLRTRARPKLAPVAASGPMPVAQSASRPPMMPPAMPMAAALPPATPFDIRPPVNDQRDHPPGPPPAPMFAPLPPPVENAPPAYYGAPEPPRLLDGDMRAVANGPPPIYAAQPEQPFAAAPPLPASYGNLPPAIAASLQRLAGAPGGARKPMPMPVRPVSKTKS